MGEKSRLEFLDQLVGPGEYNFSRIISAMSKYGLMPSAAAPGTTEINLKTAKNWLFVQPDVRQLPNFESIVHHLERGGDITFLFSPAQASDQTLLLWLGDFGVYVQRRTALGIAEDARTGGFLAAADRSLFAIFGR